MASITPLGLTEKCVKVRERPGSHRPVSASILCFMAWPSDNTKFELDYLGLIQDSCIGSTLAQHKLGK